MKSRRRVQILTVIQERVVETQEELVRLLQDSGLKVTQATISRDIKELGLVKVPSGDGRYRYFAPDGFFQGRGEQLLKIFCECVLRVVEAENIIVVTTYNATAGAVCEAIDDLGWPEVIGSMAGERNIFMILKSKEAATRVAEKLRSLTV